MAETIKFTPTPSEEVEPVQSEAPVETDRAEDLDGVDRNVYDGDVSDSILAKLSAYYNEHAKVSADYTITRPGQYTYQLVYGSSDNGSSYSDAVLVTYTLSGNYNQTASLSVSNRSSVTVDVAGSNGYVYSSAPSFIPSRYIDTSARLAEHMNILGFLFLLVMMLSGLILTWVRGRRR